ncbi:MAG TPA: glycerophosphodiester phosphodiesterase [Solirubrobacteraceae bacterium]|jgi:glycerophosphoryl diester phosphodiesterase|nr:glycerophosphodiester phosphodiesterase [Solirubrobacteraceae bacterium]
MPELGSATAGPALRPLRRVGHKGADLIAPGNTSESFDAALAAGVDMIEFDVLSEHPDGSGRLLLAHDYRALRAREPYTLDQALAHLAGEEFAQVEFDVDLKLPGYEVQVVEALQAAGLAERAMVSSMYRESLRRVRAAEPALKLGWSVPRVRRDYTTDPLTKIPAAAVIAGYRLLLPRRAREAIRGGACDAIMAQWRLVTPALVRAVNGAGGELYAWTVDDPVRITTLRGLGVTGIISNDPRLFATA